jgi:hypothetical protein
MDNLLEYALLRYLAWFVGFCVFVIVWREIIRSGVRSALREQNEPLLAQLAEQTKLLEALARQTGSASANDVAIDEDLPPPPAARRS